MTGIHGRRTNNRGIQDTYGLGNKSIISDWFNSNGSRYGTFSTVSTSGSESIDSSFKLNGCKASNTSYVLGYIFDTAGTYSARIRAATVSGATSSFGTEVNILNLAGISSSITLKYITDNKIIVAVADNASTLKLYTYTLSGNTLTQDASITSFATSLANTSVDVCMLSATRGIALYTVGTTVVTQDFTVGSGSLTAGSTLSVRTSLASVCNGIAKLTSTTAIAYYTAGNNNGNVFAKVLTDGSPPTAGSEATLCASHYAPVSGHRMYLVANRAGTTAMGFWKGSSSGDYLHAIGCAISGTSVNGRGSTMRGNAVGLGDFAASATTNTSSALSFIEDNGQWASFVGIESNGFLVTPRFVAIRDTDSIIVGGRTVSVTGGTAQAISGAGAICLTSNVIILYNTTQTIVYAAVLIK